MNKFKKMCNKFFYHIKLAFFLIGYYYTFSDIFSFILITRLFDLSGYSDYLPTFYFMTLFFLIPYIIIRVFPVLFADMYVSFNNKTIKELQAKNYQLTDNCINGDFYEKGGQVHE